MTDRLTILCGDALEQLKTQPAESVHCCVTSPPYWGLRDYGVAGQMGLEPTPEDYVSRMVEVFAEIRRVLRKDGSAWVNMGDAYCHGIPGGGCVFENGRSDHRTSYECDKARGREKISTLAPGLKVKDLIGLPWRLAFALQADGWWLRCDIIWAKPNPMPESVTDRPTRAHEYLFLLSKSARYYYDAEAIREPSITADLRRPYTSQGAWQMDGRPVEQRHGGKPRKSDAAQTNGRNVQKTNGEAERRDKLGSFNNNPALRPGLDRNRRSVWTVCTDPYPEAHFATYPEELIKPCILAGCPVGGVVLDPFAGSGTTGKVALELGRRGVLIELNPEYVKLIERRCDVTMGLAL